MLNKKDTVRGTFGSFDSLDFRSASDFGESVLPDVQYKDREGSSG
jgi:hypothetical protein